MKCVVPSCDNKGLVFGVPSDNALREKWQRALPFNITLRPDTDQGICEKHFHPSLIAHKTVLPDKSGKELFHTYYKNPILSDSAVPSIFTKQASNGLLRKKALVKGDYFTVQRDMSALDDGEDAWWKAREYGARVIQSDDESSKFGGSSYKNTVLSLHLLKPKPTVQLKTKTPLKPILPKTQEFILYNVSKITTGEKRISYIPPLVAISDKGPGKGDSPFPKPTFHKTEPKVPLSAPSSSVKLYVPGKQKIVVLKKVNAPFPTTNLNTTDDKEILLVNEPLPQSVRTSCARVPAVLENVHTFGSGDVTVQVLKDTGDGCLRLSRAVENVRCPPQILAPSTIPVCLVTQDALAHKSCSSPASSHFPAPAITLMDSVQRNISPRKVSLQKLSKAQNPISSIFSLDTSGERKVVTGRVKKKVPCHVNEVKKPLQGPLTLPSQTLPENSSGSEELLGNIHSSFLSPLPELALQQPSVSESVCLLGYSGGEDEDKGDSSDPKLPDVGIPRILKRTAAPNVGRGKQNDARLEADSVLNHKLKKKVCVIPLNEVVSQSLSKSRIQKLMAEQFGVNVPYGSKLFKVFSKNIKKFKTNYKKKIYNKEKRKTKRQRGKSSDNIIRNKRKTGTKQEKSVRNSKFPSEENRGRETICSESVSPPSFKDKFNYHSETSNVKVRTKSKLKRVPCTFGIKFLGSALKGGVSGNQLTNDSIPQAENVFTIPTSITNIYDKSQLEVLCQTLIETLHQLQNSEVEGTEVKLVVSITKNSETQTTFVEKKVCMESGGTIESSSDNYLGAVMSEGTDTLGNISSARQADFFETQSTDFLDSSLSAGVGNEDLLSIGSLPCDEVVVASESEASVDLDFNVNETQLQYKSLQTESVEKPDPVTYTGFINSPMEIAATVNTCHDHSYSPAACCIFKNPRYIVRVAENTEKAKLQSRTKVIVKPPPKKLIQKYEREKLRLQKHIFKLTAKVKSKNLHILEKNKKIKYLSGIICEEKGVKRIRFPKAKDPSNLPSSVTPTHSIAVLGSPPYLQLENLPMGREKEQISISEESVAVASLLDGSHSSDNFDQRFSDFYQRLTEISSSQS